MGNKVSKRENVNGCPQSNFSHTHKVGNNDINANFVLSYICSFLHYLYLKMLVKMKLDFIW